MEAKKCKVPSPVAHSHSGMKSIYGYTFLSLYTALLLSVTKSICRNVLEIFFKPLISTRAEMQISELNERVVQKYQVAPVEVEMSDRREREPVRNRYKLIF